MKKIEVLIRNSKLYTVKDTLESIRIKGMTVYLAKGLETQKGVTSGGRPGSASGSKLNPKTKIEIVCDDNDATKIMTAIASAAKTGNVRDGKIFIYSIEDSIRIRTDKKGFDAV